MAFGRLDCASLQSSNRLGQSMTPMISHFRCSNPGCRLCTPVTEEILECVANNQSCSVANISLLVIACEGCKHVVSSSRSPTSPVLYGGSGLPESPDWQSDLLMLRCDQETCQALTPVVVAVKDGTSIEQKAVTISTWPLLGELTCREGHRISRVVAVG